MSTDVDHVKRALRADLRERRQLRSDAQRAEAESRLADRLDELVNRLGARSVSCFLSLSAEPGTRTFVSRALARGIQVLLPVTRADGLLDWSVATEGGDVAEGMFGLPEPVGELLGPIAVNDVDLMIIPAAAVDTRGMRIGWGRGYFDKTIGSMQRCPPVYAVVFDSEILDEVPREVHDQPVTGVVTPSRIVTFAPDGR
ncbi:MAG TPA: 5-formyltetrahydrofolate cyclo-ligase [Microbacterium sp.]|nr:5-formyltetrahydrofolate cyclo-ligase [Microbacterium sp.]